ncbi:hypothetical protein PROFUN_15435 [Planoprotostelium fungivorum]|uniref:Uncharacterized protein n=1 Tax=Planoprotostelium fungivorum TaxID=1890364 RepID=A0A2P6MWS3_9EUKA|nr:hypothetical protein PROFUN_15435 [Planoprotostelium fungivorum]
MHNSLTHSVKPQYNITVPNQQSTQEPNQSLTPQDKLDPRRESLLNLKRTNILITQYDSLTGHY